MPYYKDIDAGVHFLSAEDVAAGYLSLLPEGCVEITDAQAAELTAPAQPDIAAESLQRIKARLGEIEVAKIRPSSEIALAMASGISPSAFCVKKLAALEAEAVPLRAEKKRLES